MLTLLPSAREGIRLPSRRNARMSYHQPSLTLLTAGENPGHEPALS